MDGGRGQNWGSSSEQGGRGQGNDRGRNNRDQERSGWKLDAFSRHLLALYDYERGIYAVDRPAPRIKARPKLF